MKTISSRLTVLIGLMLWSLVSVQGAQAAAPSLLLTVNPAPPGGTTTATVAILNASDVESLSLELNFSSGTSLTLPALAWFARGDYFPSAPFGPAPTLELNNFVESIARTKVFIDGFKPSGTSGNVGTVTFAVSPGVAIGATQVLNLSGQYLSKTIQTVNTFVTASATFTAGNNPKITASPGSSTFNTIGVGGQTAAQAFTITNTGTSNLAISTVTLTGNDLAEFRKTSDSCNGKSLTPNGTCTIQTAFAPTTIGAKNAVLAIASNDPNSATLLLPLSGSAVAGGVNSLVAISALADGLKTGDQVLNVAGMVVDTAGVKALSINGVATTIQQDGTFSLALQLAPGANAITTVVTDQANNLFTDIRTITQVRQGPMFSVISPTDNIRTAQAFVSISGTVGADVTVTVKVNNGSAQLAAITGSNFADTVDLVTGINTVEITATDLSGNSASVKRTIMYDDRKPSLSVTEPAQDEITGQGSALLKGTISDTLSAATVTITNGTETFTPTITTDSFEQILTFTDEKSYPVTIKATEQGGREAMIQRNIIYSKVIPTSYPSGDVTGDGKINVLDALFTLQYALSLIPHNTTNNPNYLANADVSPLDSSQKPTVDGVIDAMDAWLILQRAVNLLSW